MFRPMRRKAKEIDLQAAKELLHHARYGILAVQGDGGYPYAVPVNFLYEKENRRIVFHGAAAGHKADALRACSRVCFTVVGSETVKNEPWAPFVQSAVVFGQCRMVEDREETLRLVKKLAMKYYPDENTADMEIASSGAAVRMFVIKIEHLSGKEVQER